VTCPPPFVRRCVQSQLFTIVAHLYINFGLARRVSYNYSKGLARTLYIFTVYIFVWCIYGIFDRHFTKHTAISLAGESLTAVT